MQIFLFEQLDKLPLSAAGQGPVHAAMLILGYELISF